MRVHWEMCKCVRASTCVSTHLNINACRHPFKRRVCLCVAKYSTHVRGKDEVPSPEDKVKHFHLLLTAVALSTWNNRPEPSSQLRRTTCAAEASQRVAASPWIAESPPPTSLGAVFTSLATTREDGIF